MDHSTLAEIREWVVFLIDGGILWILIKEYAYDRDWNERMKHRRNRRRKYVEFDDLTTGEMK